MEQTISCLLMVEKFINLHKFTYIHKFINSEIFSNNMCLGNVSKDFSATNMKQTGFNGQIYDFSIDYDAISVNDILDIHEYLTKKMK